MWIGKKERADEKKPYHKKKAHLKKNAHIKKESSSRREQVATCSERRRLLRVHMNNTNHEHFASDRTVCHVLTGEHAHSATDRAPYPGCSVNLNEKYWHMPLFRLTEQIIECVRCLVSVSFFFLKAPKRYLETQEIRLLPALAWHFSPGTEESQLLNSPERRAVPLFIIHDFAFKKHFCVFVIFVADVSSI